MTEQMLQNDLLVLQNDLLDEELAIKEKLTEDEDDVSQVSQNIISFTQLYSIETLYAKLKNGSLWSPEFQRKWGLWSLKNQSFFIESIILQLPIPSIVVFSDSTFQLKVIDWLQRISTLKSFLSDWFELAGLSQIKTEPFNGFKFSDLPEWVKNQFLNSTISVITVQCTPDDEKADATYYEIFRRLNQWWLVLTPQEIRNAIYKWPFLELLRWNGSDKGGLRNNDTWKDLYKIRWNQGHNYARERDVELLLKIFALAESNDDRISKNMGDFLNTYLKKANNKSEIEIGFLETAFLKAMEYINSNNIIPLFRENKIRQSMYYNMLLSVLIDHYLWPNNWNELSDKNFSVLLSRNDLPEASSDTWNPWKIKRWREIFSEFIVS